LGKRVQDAHDGKRNQQSCEKDLADYALRDWKSTNNTL
jgi:hypothetical protein